MEVEKRTAGNSGLNATVDAIQTGEKTLLLEVWVFDIVSPWVVKGLTVLVLKGPPPPHPVTIPSTAATLTTTATTTPLTSSSSPHNSHC
nr:hypothetical protein [Tanacetum cinerariifolium]